MKLSFIGISVYGIALFVKEGELFEIDEVIALGGVAFGEDRHTSADVAACGIYKLFNCKKTLAGGDNFKRLLSIFLLACLVLGSVS